MRKLGEMWHIQNVSGTVDTVTFLKTESLHDSVVSALHMDENEENESQTLSLSLKFFIDQPELQEYCNLEVQFAGLMTSATPRIGFDIFDFDVRNRSPLTFALLDSETGDEIEIRCKESHIAVDNVFFEYLNKYERPILNQLKKVADL